MNGDGLDATLAQDTIAAYRRRHGDADFQRIMEILHPRSGDEFVQRLYTELNAVVRSLEESAPERQDDGEDRITLDVVTGLRQTGYNVTHDGYSRGHADITIAQDTFRWLGEAKVHKDYDWLLKGLRQLLSRYATGKEDGSGLLIYIQGRNANGVMEEWRRRLEKGTESGLVDTEDAAVGEKLTFWSGHTHEASGLPLRTKHVGVSLYFKPTDSSS